RSPFSGACRRSAREGDRPWGGTRRDTTGGDAMETPRAATRRAERHGEPRHHGGRKRGQGVEMASGDTGSEDRIEDPVADIVQARNEARRRQDPHVDVCILVTARADGRPEARAVSLRDVDERGFGLLLNELSPKWRQLSA